MAATEVLLVSISVTIVVLFIVFVTRRHFFPIAVSASSPKKRQLCPELSLVNEKNECLSHSDWQLISLSDMDQFQASSAAVSTATLFKCESNEARESARKWLRDRTKEIIQRNPFLAGRLQTKQKKMRSIVLLVPNIESKVFPHYESAAFIDCSVGHSPSPIILSESSSQDDFIKVAHAIFDVDMGSTAVNRDCPLFQIAFIPTIDNYSFYLFVTMNHVLGDAFTYYSIYSELSSRHPLDPTKPAGLPSSMPFERPIPTHTVHRLASGQNWVQWIESWISLTRILLRFLCAYFTPDTTKHRTFRVRTDVLTQQKYQLMLNSNGQEVVSGVDFISSNDVLTSRLASAFSASHTVMPANLRERWKGDDLDRRAGNYSPMMFLNHKFSASPFLIRQALHEFEKRVKHNQANSLPEANTPPTCFQTVFQYRGLLVTNWASLYQPILLPAAVPSLHECICYSKPGRPTLLGRARICRIDPMDPKSLAVTLSTDEATLNSVTYALNDILESVHN